MKEGRYLWWMWDLSVSRLEELGARNLDVVCTRIGLVR